MHTKSVHPYLLRHHTLWTIRPPAVSSVSLLSGQGAPALAALQSLAFFCTTLIPIYCHTSIHIREQRTGKAQQIATSLHNLAGVPAQIPPQAAGMRRQSFLVLVICALAVSGGHPGLHARRVCPSCWWLLPAPAELSRPSGPHYCSVCKSSAFLSILLVCRRSCLLASGPPDGLHRPSPACAERRWLPHSCMHSHNTHRR